MTTITLTPQTDTAAVQLSILNVKGISAITRSDANGVTDVRTRAGVLGVVPGRVEDARNRCGTPSADGGASTGWTTRRTTIAPNAGLISAAVNRKYFRVTVTDVTNSTAFQSVDYQTAAVTPGTTYYLSLWARTQGAPRGVEARLYFLDANGSSLGSSVSNTVTGASWSLLNTLGTAPAGAVTMLIRVSPTNMTSWVVGDFYDFGAVLLSAKSSGYYDGASLGDDQYAYTWSGAAYASESVRWVQDGPIIITDYEAANGAISYDVLANGSAVSSTADTVLAMASPWLYVPIMPSYSVPVPAVTGYTAQADTRSTVLDLPGRRLPLAVLREMGGRRGSMDLWSGSYRSALDVLDACGRGEVLMFRQPDHDGMDMYFTPESATITSLQNNRGRTVWGVSLQYAEVDRPDGFIAGAAGWTFASVAAGYAAFKDLPKFFDTFQDLRLNEVQS